MKAHYDGPGVMPGTREAVATMCCYMHDLLKVMNSIDESLKRNAENTQKLADAVTEVSQAVRDQTSCM